MASTLEDNPHAELDSLVFKPTNRLTDPSRWDWNWIDNELTESENRSDFATSEEDEEDEEQEIEFMCDDQNDDFPPLAEDLTLMSRVKHRKRDVTGLFGYLSLDLLARIFLMMDARHLSSLECTCKAWAVLRPELGDLGLCEYAAREHASARELRLRENERWIAVLRFAEIVGSESQRVVSAGQVHTVLLDESGAVSTFGTGQGGRLGHNDEADQLAPRPVTALEGVKVLQVSGGSTHTSVVTQQGRLFTFGCGTHGQLGHGVPVDTQPVPTQVKSLEGVRVVQVSGGHFHTAAVTSTGVCYTWGYGGNGQLGQGDDQDQLIPRPVPGLSKVWVVQVSAGSAHTVAVTSTGGLFTWGSGMYGQLGHGCENDELKPAQVVALQDERVVAAVAGDSHSAVITLSGALYTFGYGAHGQLGHGDREEQLLPKAVEALEDINVIQVCAGYLHSAIVTSGGVLLTCGSGADGRLGHGDEEDQLVPRAVEALDSVRIVQVSVGTAHTAVVTASGTVLTFGDGANGRLGNGTEESQLVPRAMAALQCEEVVDPRFDRGSWERGGGGGWERGWERGSSDLDCICSEEEALALAESALLAQRRAEARREQQRRRMRARWGSSSKTWRAKLLSSFTRSASITKTHVAVAVASVLLLAVPAVTPTTSVALGGAVGDAVSGARGLLGGTANATLNLMATTRTA